MSDAGLAVAQSQGSAAPAGAGERPPNRNGGPRHAASKSTWALGRLSGLQQAVLLSAAVTLINLWWVLRDHAGPSWDQSHYLYLTWTFRQALDHHGPWAFVHAVYATDASHAPLLPILLVPFTYLLGQGTGAALALNLVLWPVLLLSAGAIAREFFDDRARLITIVLLAPMPLVVWLSHQVLQDFLLVTLTVGAILLLVRTRLFQRRAASIGLGVVIGAGMLTKFSFFVGFIGPAAVTLFACGFCWVSAHRESGTWDLARRSTANLTIAAVLALIPTLLWYVPSWTPTAAYLKTQLQAQPGSIVDPLNPTHLAAFVVGTGENMSWWAVGITLVVLLAGVPRLTRWLTRSGPRRDTLLRAAFLSSWLLIPIIVVAANVNQDPRYVIAAYPALAVVTGGLTGALRPAILRRTIIGIVIATTTLQILQIDVPGYRTPLLADHISFHTPLGWITIPFTGGDGPAVAPTPVNATVGIIETLESESRGPSGHLRPAVVILPELESLANGNDLTYYALTRHDPFTFVTVEGATTSRQLEATLRAANFVLYARQPPVSAGSDAVSQINQSDPARRMTPNMFRLFLPHPAYIYVGADSDQSPYIAVLQRR